jgi:hypothetical protein
MTQIYTNMQEDTINSVTISKYCQVVTGKDQHAGNMSLRIVLVFKFFHNY